MYISLWHIWYNCTAEDDVATVKDSSSSPPKYACAGGVASQHPSELPPPYTERPSYPIHTTGQAIPASGLDRRDYQTPLHYPQQQFYQGTPGGLVVTGVSFLLDICFNPKNSVCIFLYISTERKGLNTLVCFRVEKSLRPMPLKYFSVHVLQLIILHWFYTCSNLATLWCPCPLRTPQSQTTIKSWHGLHVFAVSGQLVS